DYREAVQKNTALDALQKRAQLKLIDGLDGQLRSTIKSMENLARILAGEGKYGWGSRVGFDGSERKSYSDQLALRPNDPFLHVAIAVREAATDPASAAERFFKAAQLVPQDVDPGVDIFDRDRAELCLTAARIAEHASRLGGRTDPNLARAA